VSGLPGFIADLDTLVEGLRRRAMTVSANPQERQMLIRRLRQAIAQIRHWQRQTSDEGDLILLEIAREDFETILRSLGVLLASRVPTMRDLLDHIAAGPSVFSA